MKNLIITALLFIGMQSFAQNCQIKANLENVTNGELAVVNLTSTHVEEKPLDTFSVTGSAYECIFGIPEPRLLLVIFPTRKKYKCVMA